MKEKDDRFNKRLIDGSSKLSSFLDSDSFLDPVDSVQVAKDLKSLMEDAKGRSHKVLYKVGLVNHELKDNLQTFASKYDSFRSDVECHNEKILLSKVKEVGEIINPIEGRDLDEQQLSAIAFDIRSRLVIAGAGTGKTTTIIGLVKYLLKTELAEPEEVLLLSFTNASVNELKERIIRETGKRVHVSTFHRLGLNIIASSDGKVPKITSTDLNDFIK